MNAAAKRREAALSSLSQTPVAFKFEQMKHGNYHPQILDTGSIHGSAFHFDTFLSYSTGHANQNNNCNIDISET